MSLQAVLQDATRVLKSKSSSARLDAELLLCEVLACTRAALFAHSERLLTEAEHRAYQEILVRRSRGEPLAYIVGHQEFWSLDFRVTPAVLIPRPETELLVERALQLLEGQSTACRLADLGVGSGAVALALAHERPSWQVIATDQAAAALSVAKVNASRLGLLNVQFYLGSWCAALPSQVFDLILSNPPYLTEAELIAAPSELQYEPRSALVADEEGLAAFYDIISSAKPHLKSGAYLLLEHGSTQAHAVRGIFLKEGYTEVQTFCDLAGLERVSQGRFKI